MSEPRKRMEDFDDDDELDSEPFGKALKRAVDYYGQMANAGHHVKEYEQARAELRQAKDAYNRGFAAGVERAAQHTFQFLQEFVGLEPFIGSQYQITFDKLIAEIRALSPEPEVKS